MVGIICPSMVGIELTDLPKSGGVNTPLCPIGSADSELLYCCLTHPLCATTSGRFRFTMVMKFQVMVQKVACNHTR